MALRKRKLFQYVAQKLPGLSKPSGKETSHGYGSLPLR
jgi:hypothetical protein